MMDGNNCSQIRFKYDFGNKQVRYFTGIWREVFDSGQRCLVRNGNVYYINGGGKTKVIPKNVAKIETKKRKELYSTLFKVTKNQYIYILLTNKTGCSFESWCWFEYTTINI